MIFLREMRIVKVILWVIFLLAMSGCEDSSFVPLYWWEEISPEEMGMHRAKLLEASDYARGSGFITRSGKVVLRWGSSTKRYDLKSTTKSIAITALGLAIKDGKMNLSDNVQQYYSNLSDLFDGKKNIEWLDEITLFQLATHTAGFDKPGGYGALLFKPGTAWAYSDGGTNWLADSVTLAYGKDLEELMFDRVFTPLDISSRDLIWRDNIYREYTINGIKRREFGSGISANVDAMARIGYLHLRRGQWNEKQIIPRNFIDLLRTTPPVVAGLPVVNDKRFIFADASNHYGLLWWNNADGALAHVPRDAYWSFGLYDSFIVVIPSLDIVATRAGASWSGNRRPSYYKVLRPFLEPIVDSVNYGAPYPNSPVISNIIWDDSSHIVRKASGSDNWPITWADDNNLYTAYGDGYGFDPKLPEKLSMGFAKVKGLPADFSGINLRSSDEQYGNGKRGKKASGILMVDSILYLWVRNANNNGEHCQLAWSTDYAQNWTWSSWKFEEFGYCNFINFGKNYSGARDAYVYTVTHDEPSAYKRANRFILMRVPKGQIIKKNSYEFFVKLDSNGKPIWTSNITQRGAVFFEKGMCFRSSISYNAGIRRYIWWQAKYNESFDGRFEGGFGVFDAPEPWGPWTTMFYIEQKKWDTGGGETGSFPIKWMSEDGKTMHLVFSGNDAFSVRKATLVTLDSREN